MEVTQEPKKETLDQKTLLESEKKLQRRKPTKKRTRSYKRSPLEQNAGKYGRVFTLSDVEKIVEQARKKRNAPIEDVVGGLKLTFPGDEPVYPFRASDRRALAQLRNYATMEASRANPNRKHLVEIDRMVEAFEEFRRKYPERIRDAD